MNLFKRGIDALRQPDRSPRCYDMTEDERQAKILECKNYDVWNTPEQTDEDELNYYNGA